MWPLDGCRTRYIVGIVIAVLLLRFYLTRSLPNEYVNLDAQSEASIDSTFVDQIQSAAALYQDCWSDLLARLSIIGCMAAIVACIVVFVTYSCFKSLRSLNGLCLMNLTLALGLSNYAMLSASDGNLPMPSRDGAGNSTSPGHSNNCKVAAVSLHFFILARFAWSSVVALQFLRTLDPERKKFDTRATESKRYTQYCIYGWLLPAVMCSLCLVHELKSSEVYGRSAGTMACWIIHEETKMSFFLIPFGVTLMLNLCCFLRLIHPIHQLLQQARSAQCNDIRQHNEVSWSFEVRLFIGMFSTFGLTSMLEYVIAMEQLGWLQKPFTLLQILQGPIMLLNFMLQKGVKVSFAQAILHIQQQILRKAISFVNQLQTWALQHHPSQFTITSSTSVQATSNWIPTRRRRNMSASKIYCYLLKKLASSEDTVTMTTELQTGGYGSRQYKSVIDDLQLVALKHTHCQGQS